MGYVESVVDSAFEFNLIWTMIRYVKNSLSVLAIVFAILFSIYVI